MTETEPTPWVRPATVTAIRRSGTRSCTALGDYPRLVFSEVHGDETGATAVVVSANATSWFDGRSAIVRRVLGGNGARR